MSASSELTNRIGLWGKVKVKTRLGNSMEDSEITKLWAKIIPNSGSVKTGAGETEYSDTNFKIKIRNSKREITQQNWVVYQGQKYEIKYIIPDFKNRTFRYLYCNLIVE